MSSLRQRQPRNRNDKHLSMVRTMPCCCGCGRPAPSEAAHIRGNWACPEKPSIGMQEKPDDKWTVPLNAWCHRDGPDAQHKGSEKAFWLRVGKDPFVIAKRLWRLSGEPICTLSKTKPVKSRKPAEQRKSISGRSEIISRGFDSASPQRSASRPLEKRI